MYLEPIVMCAIASFATDPEGLDSNFGCSHLLETSCQLGRGKLAPLMGVIPNRA